MRLIVDWDKKKLKCTECGIELSVKYEHNDKPYCNKCIVVATIRNK